MSDELREEIRKLKEEMADLKEQLSKSRDEEERSRRGHYTDMGAPMREYIDDVMQGVAEGIRGELGKSIFIGPRGVRISAAGEWDQPETEQKVDFSRTAKTMSALGEEHRLKILRELMRGGKYINELQEKLPEITTSTLSSHLSVLEEEGLVAQEKMRGRYLITIPGRTIYKMALRISRFMERTEGT